MNLYQPQAVITTQIKLGHGKENLFLGTWALPCLNVLVPVSDFDWRIITLVYQP